MFVTEVVNTNDLPLSLSQLNIGETEMAGTQDGPSTPETVPSQIPQTSFSQTYPERMYVFNTMMETSDLSDGLRLLKLDNVTNSNYNETGAVLQCTTTHVPLATGKTVSRHSLSDRRSRVTGLSGYGNSLMLREAWQSSQKVRRSVSWGGSASSSSSHSVPSPEMLDAQTQWENSRRKRHFKSGYSNKEQWWTPRNTSNAMLHIENLRRSHREAQKAAKRKEKTTVYDKEHDSEDEIL